MKYYTMLFAIAKSITVSLWFMKIQKKNPNIVVCLLQFVTIDMLQHSGYFILLKSLPKLTLIVSFIYVYIVLKVYIARGKI